MSDDVFLRHAEELARRAEYQPQLTPFLTPAEQRELFDTLTAFRPRTVFWGGFGRVRSAAEPFSFPTGSATVSAGIARR